MFIIYVRVTEIWATLLVHIQNFAFLETKSRAAAKKPSAQKRLRGAEKGKIF